MSFEERAAASRSICDRVLALIDAAEAAVVHTFWPIERLHEVDTRFLINRLVESGVTIALPVVSPDFRGSMTQRAYSTREALLENGFGGLEPATGRPISADEVDVAVVPALAADRRGHRVGYGGGYYDRFLATLGCQTVCVVYSGCLVEHIPDEAHDVTTDFVVTELSTIATRDPAT